MEPIREPAALTLECAIDAAGQGSGWHANGADGFAVRRASTICNVIEARSGHLPAATELRHRFMGALCRPTPMSAAGRLRIGAAFGAMAISY